MRFLIDLVYLLVILALSPKLIYRSIRQNRYRSGWSERLGHIDRLQPEKPCIWIHAVSVGEVNSTQTIVAGLKKVFADFEIVISSTTDTGFSRAHALYAVEHRVFYFPLDLSFIIEKAFDNIQPAICLLMELEVWPNFTRSAWHRAVPIVVVNGRISDRSFPRYRAIRFPARSIFRKVALVLAQTEEYARRFRMLGCDPDKVIVTGSLKYDTAEIADSAAGAEELAEKLGIAHEPLLVAGGTGPGEEKIILDVFSKVKKNFGELRLVIVPRKPERFDEAAKMIEQAGFALRRYSGIKKGESSGQVNSEAVILGDTMGDLRRFYSLAKVVFVGRSLVPMGGSDMMEAAALGKCTIFGPYTFNFKQTVDALLAGGGAVEVANEEELAAVIEKCLTDEGYREGIARRGQEIIRQNQGATAKSVEAISKLPVKLDRQQSVTGY
ncbi:MAG: 3-deoxy-D-manno-octulosonic acid transferase [Planctomycetota bacterium]